MGEMTTKERWLDRLRTNEELIAWIVWGFVLGLLVGILVMMV